MERLAHLAQSTSHGLEIMVISRTILVPRAGQRTGGVGTVNGSAVDVIRTSRASLYSSCTGMDPVTPSPRIILPHLKGLVDEFTKPVTAL